MPTLQVTPSPALKGSTVRYDGTNFPNAKTRILLDGVGATTNIFRPAPDGSFHDGINVSSTVRVQTLTAEQADSNGKWRQVASVTIPVVTTLPPVITPVPKVVRAASIGDLKKYLADDSVDECDVVGGTYAISAASLRKPDSLWIGAAFASRTRPILVKPVTPGAVAFDGQGVPGSTWMTFAEGAHDQTWQGFRTINMRPQGTGLVVFGGDPTLVPPHHLSLLDMTVDVSNRRAGSTSNQEHTYYFAAAKGDGPHDILVDGLTIDGQDDPVRGVWGLWSGIHMDHGDAVAPASHHVIVRNLRTLGLNFPVILWTPQTRSWLFEGADIKYARQYAVRFESIGATGIIFKDMTSTGSGNGGFLSSMGPNPPGVTFVNDHLA